MKEQALADRLERISASDYVNGIRAQGRENLDAALRAEMSALNQPRRAPDPVLAERAHSLRILAARAGAGAPDPIRLDAPSRWSDYVNDTTGRLRLEFLTALPQTNHHEEVAFLRTIHLTEACL